MHIDVLCVVGNVMVAVNTSNELPTNVFCNCSGSIKVKKQMGLELALSVFNFNVHQSCQHVGPLLEHKVSHVVRFMKFSNIKFSNIK